jgi:predicted DsbA family dithiol-disulfide isomerase
MNISVDVISDVICPWCFIGKRRLEKAIAEYGMPVTVSWHPFQLNPAMPKAGISRREYRIAKFGSWERSMELDANIVAVGKQEGIQFDFDRMERTPNTIDAHRLIWLSNKDGIQDAVVEALFQAYFTDGRDISNPKTLIDVVAEAGLDRGKAEAVLNGNEGMDVLKEAGELSGRYHVEGVPFFVVNRKITLSGAQSPNVFVTSFEQASDSQLKGPAS